MSNTELVPATALKVGDDLKINKHSGRIAWKRPGGRKDGKEYFRMTIAKIGHQETEVFIETTCGAKIIINNLEAAIRYIEED